MSCQPALPPAPTQDPEGALLESGDLIPEQMSRLLPEVGDDKTPEEEAQPGTGASFRFPNCIINHFKRVLRGTHNTFKIYVHVFILPKVGVPNAPAEFVTLERHDGFHGNSGA